MSKTKVHNPKADTVEEYDGQFREFNDDEMGHRVIEVGNRSFNVIQKNPWALWHIVPAKGPVPKELSGTFTNVRLAQQAIELYLSGKN